MPPKNVFLVILLIPALAISYYFAVALPANQRATLQFEKDKYQAEKAEKEKREAEAIVEASSRKTRFDSCVVDADFQYWNYVKLNGTPVPGKSGTYNATVQVWDTADKRKANAVAECHRLWDK